MISKNYWIPTLSGVGEVFKVLTLMFLEVVKSLAYWLFWLSIVTSIGFAFGTGIIASLKLFGIL